MSLVKMVAFIGFCGLAIPRFSALRSRMALGIRTASAKLRVSRRGTSSINRIQRESGCVAAGGGPLTLDQLFFP